MKVITKTILGYSLAISIMTLTTIANAKAGHAENIERNCRSNSDSNYEFQICIRNELNG